MHPISQRASSRSCRLSAIPISASANPVTTHMGINTAGAPDDVRHSLNGDKASYICLLTSHKPSCTILADKESDVETIF